MTQRLDPLEIVNTPPPKEDPRPTGMLGAGVNYQTLNQARLAGDSFSVGEDFVSSDLAQRAQDRELQAPMFGVGEDVRVEQVRGGTPRFVETALGGMLRSNIQSGGEADLRQFQDQGTANRLQEVGLQGTYELGQYKGYNYNPTTGEYDYYDNTPSFLDQAIPALIKAGVMTAVTGGLSVGLSAATGMGAGMATGLTTGAMTLAQGGDVKDAVVNGLTAGLGEEVKNLNAAVKAGTATKEMVATAEVLNNVKNVANLAQAVESGNVLQAITSGMDLAGLGSVRDVIGQGVQAVAGNNQFINNNLDAITNAVTKVTTEGIKGTDPAMMIAKGLWEYGKSGGELPNVDFDFSTGNWDTPEWLKAIDKEALQPIKDSIKAGYDELNDKVLNPIQEKTDELIRELPTTKEGWEEAEDYIKNEVAPTVREAGRDIRGLLPSVGLPSIELSGLGNGLFRGQPMGGKGLTDESLILSDENPLLTDYETLDNNLLQQLQI